MHAERKMTQLNVNPSASSIFRQLIHRTGEQYLYYKCAQNMVKSLKKTSIAINTAKIVYLCFRITAVRQQVAYIPVCLYKQAYRRSYQTSIPRLRTVGLCYMCCVMTLCKTKSTTQHTDKNKSSR